MFEQTKEFLLRFNSLEDLKIFSSSFPMYTDLCTGEFKCDGCFYCILPSVQYQSVRRHLYNFDLYRVVQFCYPVALKTEPFIL